MPKGKVTTKPKDILLTVVFVFIILVGFVGIWYVAEFTNGQSEQLLWQTDSDTKYDVLEGDYTFTTYQTSTEVPSGPFQYNRTPAYLGNNTWGMSVNATTLGTLNYALINLPELNNWLISTVVINLTVPLDADLGIYMSIYSHPVDKLLATNWAHTRIYTDVGAGGDLDGYYNQSVTIPLTIGLSLYDHASHYAEHSLSLMWDDIAPDGMSAFSPQWSIEIYGQKQTGWSLTDKLALVVGFADFLLIMGVIYVQDQFDIFGYVKDLPSTKKRGK